MITCFPSNISDGNLNSSLFTPLQRAFKILMLQLAALILSHPMHMEVQQVSSNQFPHPTKLFHLESAKKSSQYTQLVLSNKGGVFYDCPRSMTLGVRESHNKDKKPNQSMSAMIPLVGLQTDFRKLIQLSKLINQSNYMQIKLRHNQITKLNQSAGENKFDMKI